MFLEELVVVVGYFMGVMIVLDLVVCFFGKVFGVVVLNVIF